MRLRWVLNLGISFGCVTVPGICTHTPSLTLFQQQEEQQPLLRSMTWVASGGLTTVVPTYTYQLALWHGTSMQWTFFLLLLVKLSCLLSTYIEILLYYALRNLSWISFLSMIRRGEKEEGNWPKFNGFLDVAAHVFQHLLFSSSSSPKFPTFDRHQMPKGGKNKQRT